MSSVVESRPVLHVRQLVLLLNAVVLAAAQNHIIGEFMALKSRNGSRLCALSTPDSNVSVTSKLDCYRHCAVAGCACKSGANYRTNEKLCDMFSALPVEYQLVPNYLYIDLCTELCLLPGRMMYVFYVTQRHSHLARGPRGSCVQS